MDSIDDFEFKPITEGLGFHKKPIANKTSVTGTGAKSFMSEKVFEKAPTSNQPSNQTRKPVNSHKKSGMIFEPTLSGDITDSLGSAVISPKPQSSLVTEPATPRIQKNRVEQVHVTPASSNRTANVILPAIIFDAFVVLGLSCLFSFVVLVVAQLDPLVILRMSVSDPMTTIAVGVLVFSVQQLYTIISRSFFGGTMGEWAFEAELGTQDQQASAFYPLQVLLRSLLISLTGYITLPIASLILRNDIAGQITGLKLYRH